MTIENANLQEVTGMSGHDYHSQFKKSVDWTDSRLEKITRMRMLSDPGMPWWDVTYCHGVLKDGTKVNVCLPFSQLPKRNPGVTIVEYATRDRLYAKRLGIFDAMAKLC